MCPIKFFVTVGAGLLWLAQPCSAGIILSIAPTARVDLDTQVKITYTVSAAADAGVQDVREYGFRVQLFQNHPNYDRFLDPITEIILPPNGSPWGVNESFLSLSHSTAGGSVFLASENVSEKITQINTTGGMVGSFAVLWRRPATGQFDAAMTPSMLSGAYRFSNTPADFVPVTTFVIGSGVSTIVAVPEPGSTMLTVIAGSGVLCWHRRRKRTGRARSVNSVA